MAAQSLWTCEKQIDKIVWCSGSDQPELFLWLREHIPNITILDYFPSKEIENKKLFNPNKINLCVADDLMEVGGVGFFYLSISPGRLSIIGDGKRPGICKDVY